VAPSTASAVLRVRDFMTDLPFDETHAWMARAAAQSRGSRGEFVPMLETPSQSSLG
jgi:hypothetical protein